MIIRKLQKAGRIDFVHGSGTGVSRSELIKILNRKFPEFANEDAPSTTYGYQGSIRVTAR